MPTSFDGCFVDATLPRDGGALLLEVGGDQADLLDEDLNRLGYVDVDILADEDGDVRGIEATFVGPRPADLPP